jgi:hypothetical protein
LNKKVLKVWLIKTYDERGVAFGNHLMKELGDRLGIRIELHHRVWSSVLGMLLDAFSRGEAPDVFMLGFTWIHTLSHLKLLKPLPEDMAIRPVLAPWMSGCITCQGQAQAYPWLSDPLILNCRLDIMDMFGVHSEDLSTRQGLMTACEHIETTCKKKGINNLSSMYFTLKPPSPMLNRSLAFLFKEGWEFPEYGKIPMNFSTDPRSLHGFNNIWELMRICGVSFSNVRMTGKLMYDIYNKDKQFAFYNGGVIELLDNLLAGVPTDVTRFTAVPLPPNATNAKTFGGGSALAVSSATREPAEMDTHHSISTRNRDGLLGTIPEMS